MSQAKWKPRINVVDFATRPELLNLSLFPKQKQLLTDFWESKSSTGIWSIGRRSGKTTLAAVSAIYAAIVYGEVFAQKVRKGENFYILFVATNQDQATIALGMVKGLLEESPLLKSYIDGEPTANAIKLKNGAIFKAMPCTSRGTRGWNCAFAVFDEAAHFTDTGGNASGDSLYAAIVPATAQFGGYSKILLISSPWAKQGLFFELYEKSLEEPGLFYVANYATWEMNPSISQEFYDQEKLIKPEFFDVEYGAQFFANAAGYLDGETIERAINRDRDEQGPKSKYKGKYLCSLDPALHGDAYVAVIAHYEKDKLVVDRWHEFKPTFDLGDGKKKQVDVARVEDWVLYQHTQYRFYKVILDQYQSAATIQRLSRKLRITELNWTQSSKTEYYARMKAKFNADLMELYPHKKALKELRNLSYKILPGGGMQISGGSGTAVDDHVSALAALFSVPTINTSLWDNL